jgi:Poly(R)-hydroxyalkanoic acid synthase subunit (PHA_synth_III_E)
MSEDYYESFYKSWLDYSKKFFSAWQPGSEESSTQPGRKDQSPLARFQSGFFNQAQNLFERLTWFPPFSMIQGTTGPAFDQYKKYWELVGLYSQLYQEWTNVYLDFSRSVMTTVTSTNAKLAGSGLIPSKQSREVYGEWMEGMESGLDSLLRNQAFAAKLGAVLSKMLDVRKKSDEFMDGYYSMMNMPTRTELNRVYKELYLMKKQLRKLSSEKSNRNSEKVSPEEQGSDQWL